MLDSFHFIEPLWLMALIPLGLVLVWTWRTGAGDDPWRRVVDAPLLSLLSTGRSSAAGRGAGWLLAGGWLIAVLALANPTWERVSQPVFQTTAARVIVLDLSRTMEASDLAPSRLVRARYKIEDVLAQTREGQTGLVAYAGDAFTVSPLTRDGNTVSSLLKVLEPGIMPVQGSRADLGLLKAGELLRQAGVASGQILLIADGVEPGTSAASERAAAKLKSQGYRVSVLGAGATGNTAAAGAQGSGAGTMAIPPLETAALQSIARAGGGDYAPMSASGDALARLLGASGSLQSVGPAASDSAAQSWKARGPFLILMLLPLAALAFRRNWLLGVVVLIGIAAPPQPAMASTWDNLWQRPDQQAAKALVAGDYATVASVAKDPGRLGAAAYKLGKYLEAAAHYAHAGGADADYNLGNALAKLGKYPDAIAAYDKSLKQRADNQDAIANKAAVETMLKQQQKQPQQQRQQASDQGGAQQEKNHGEGAQTGQEQGAQQNQGKGAEQNQGEGAQEKQGQGAQQKKGEGGQQNQGQGAQTNQGQGAQTNQGQGAQPNQGQGGQGSQDTQSQPQSAGKSGEPRASDAAGAAQQAKSGNEFADAAKQLEDRRGKPAKGDDGALPSPNTSAAAGQPSQGAASDHRQPGDATGTAASAKELKSEEQIAAEQWLRRIPDDPGGLLRRKFLYQYGQRTHNATVDD